MQYFITKSNNTPSCQQIQITLPNIYNHPIEAKPILTPVWMILTTHNPTASCFGPNNVHYSCEQKYLAPDQIIGANTSGPNLNKFK